MSKESIKQSFKQVIADRPFIALLVGLMLAGVVYVLVIGFSIHPRDVQIYTRYTAFGEAHFYKSPWQYTLAFVGFGLFVSAAHAMLMIKLHSLQRRQSALFIGWLGVMILFVAAIFVLSIVRFAFK